MQDNNQICTQMGQDEINLFDCWLTIKKRRKVILYFVCAATLLSIVASLLMTKIYRGKAVIIPVSSKSSGGIMSSLSSQFGGLASIAGITVPGEAGDATRFMTILASRTLAEDVIKTEGLLPVLFEEEWKDKTGVFEKGERAVMEDAVMRLREIVRIEDEKDSGVVSITAEFTDPAMSAKLANGYVDALQRFINDNALTSAKRNRIFIEKQLAENKRDLLESGKEINEFYKGNRISASDAKVDVSVDVSSLPQGVSDFVDDSAANSPSGGNASHDAKAATDELKALASQKAELEKKIGDANVVRNVPQQVYLTYLTMRRELLAKMNALLTTQYEMAKIEESKEDLSFQVIDKAVVPEKRAKPERSKIVMLSFMASIFFGVFTAFFMDYIEKVKKEALKKSQV